MFDLTPFSVIRFAMHRILTNFSSTNPSYLIE